MKKFEEARFSFVVACPDKDDPSETRVLTDLDENPQCDSKEDEVGVWYGTLSFAKWMRDEASRESGEEYKIYILTELPL